MTGDAAPRQPLVVVDAANVIGSRPDGWWRDRAGAARRLLGSLAGGLPDEGEVVVVLEGAARGGADPGMADGVLVAHAAGSGDDAIVDIVAEAASEGDRPVTVVTADRGLRERVAAHGATTVGPRWLWDRIDRQR